MNTFKNLIAFAALALGLVAAPVLAHNDPVFALGSAPSVASVTAPAWGAPIVFAYQAAKEQGVIAGKTETLRTVQNSPTNPRLTTYVSRWDSIQSFANVVRIQFRAGDPAYPAIIAWTQTRTVR